MQLYRKASFGRLAELMILDTRQYRTDQPNGDRRADLNENALDPRNTLLGAEQEGWLKASLLASTGTWNVLAQQVMMGLVDLVPGEVDGYSMDQWPGFSPQVQKEVFEETKTAGATVIKLKGGSGFAVGLSIREVVHSLALDSRRVLPVSTVVHVSS